MTVQHRSNQNASSWWNGVAVNATAHSAMLPLMVASVAKSTGVFDVTCSGDGDALVSATGSVFTGNSYASNVPYGSLPAAPNSPKIARSVFNDRQHLVVTHTGSGSAISLSTMNGSSISSDLRVKVSPGGFDGTTATPDTAPLANNGSNDEALVFGGGTDASPTGVGIPSNYLQGYTRFLVGASDDPVHPFLYFGVWLGAGNGGPASAVFFVWDTVVRSAAKVAVDPTEVVFGCWTNPTILGSNVLSPAFFTGATQEGWWGRFGATTQVYQFRCDYPSFYSNTALLDQLSTSWEGRTPRCKTRLSRSLELGDSTPIGIKGMLRNIELCLVPLASLAPKDDADNQIQSAFIRWGNLYVPYNRRYGLFSGAGQLPKV